MNIEYNFTLDNGTSHKFEVAVNRVFDHQTDRAAHSPWAKLEYNQCHNCPLNTAEFRHCPVALDVEEIALRFADIISYESVQVEVITPERTYLKRCDVQTALRSLLGLVMATSACPILSRLKNLAAYHLPFSTLDETLFRTTGAYLLKQYFIYKEGGKPDLELAGLNRLYQELLTVNRCFKQRIDAACSKDANLNALGSLFALSMAISFSLDDKLKELERKISPPDGIDQL